MKEDCLLITSIICAIYAFYFDNGMKLNDGYTQNWTISYKNRLDINITMKIIKKAWNWI